MENNPRPGYNVQAYEEACRWLLDFRLEQPDAAARNEFDAWLRRSPENVAAYIDAAAIWNEPAARDDKRRWNVETLLAQAALDDDTIVALERSGRTSAIPALRKNHSGRYWAAAAASIGILSVSVFFYLQRDTYSTGIGEQRFVTLADGSSVELNARTRLRVRFTKTTRQIDLMEGQALFQVAHDKARPFTVISDDTQVRAVGTQFDVYRKTSGTLVTVVEGRVAIKAPLQSSDVMLSAGEQVVITARETLKPAQPSIAAATAWTRRRLVFESATLQEVAEEFNRHNERPLLIEDSDLYGFHITGTFSSADPGSLLKFLKERSGIAVEERADKIVISRR